MVTIVADEEIEQLRKVLRALSADVEWITEIADHEEHIALGQTLGGLRRERRQLEPVDPALVGQHHAESPGRAENRDTLPARLGAA